jgi:TetR/AcrR family transcriptional regulator, repressor for neighboring sulfatase
LAAKKKRVRRRPEDARALILDAAEKSMAADGPAGIRLQDVAKAAGVSHPTILHHFGSREGLVRALNLRTLEDLTRTVVERMAGAQSGDDGIARTFAAYRGGLARRIVWSLQAEPPPAAGQTPLFDNVVQGLHALRKSLAKPGKPPDIADTRAVVHLVTVAALGDALIGARLRAGAGQDEGAQSAAFEKWFSDLITLFLRSKV